MDRKKVAGVSMVELMIALAVMAVAILGVMSVIIHTINTKEKMRELDIAKQATATKIEQLRGLDWTTLGNTASTAYAAWTVTELAHTASPVAAAPQRAYGTVTVHNDLAADPTPDLLDLEITIYWVGVGGSSKYSARSMFTE